MTHPKCCSALLLFSLFATAGCSSSGDTTKAPGKKKVSSDVRRATVVARMDKREITIGELEDYLQSQNQYVRMRFSSPERKKVFLEKMVRLEVLVAEAKKRGLESHPDVQRRVKQALVDRLLKDLNRDLVKFSDITVAAIKARYDKNISKYNAPAKVRAVQIVLKTEAEAQKLIPQLKKIRGMRELAPLVAKHSVDAETKKKGGDLGFFAQDDKALPPEVVAAAFAIPKVTGVAGPLKVSGGFALLVKVATQPARNRPLAAVRDEIKNLLFKELRFKAVKGYADKLKEKAKVEIFAKEISKVRVKAHNEVKVPAGTSTPFKKKMGGTR
ncbi:MAG: peptidyl-prolyl cis-trans isomerase [Deltaproteobacteria bacterium]|nr:peptidyl-prolyl cis-trans isomerase [Deltaproteobacteria bacterium]